MNKLAGLAIVAAMLVPTPARACSDADLIPDWVGLGLGGAMLGGYVGGTIYFAHEDAAGRHDRDYIGGEIAFNGIFTTIYGMATVDALRHGKLAALPAAGMTALHGALLVHGVRNANMRFDSLNGTAATWTLGSAYVLETLVYLEGTGDRHDRSYGITEAAINAPVAAGLGYLAYRAHQDDRSTGHAILYTGMAAVSAALAIDGVKTALSAHRAKIDVLGDITPTIVDDGRELAPGLGTSGTF
jgi:hypothetical protein